MLNEIAQCTSKSPCVQSSSILIEHKYVMINNYENKNTRCDKAAQSCFVQTQKILISVNFFNVSSNLILVGKLSSEKLR